MAAAKKVVCVGDCPHEMVEQIKLIVHRQDIEFTEATGEHEGLEAIRRVKPDLVFLDLMALDMAGWEVYRRMKSDSELKHVPAIGTSVKELREMAHLARYDIKALL
jgi:two-component system alkaline phosphatase synthesis response regulator PhoP